MRNITDLSRVALAGLVLLIPLAVNALLHLPFGSAGVHQWLPERRAERQQYDLFLKQFGSDQVLLVSWDGATLEDRRVPQWIENLRGLACFDDYFESVVAPIEIVESLETSRLELKRTEIVRRLQGTLIGESGLQVLVLMVTERGATEHAQVIELVRYAADQVPGLHRDHLRLAGTVYESHAIDLAAQQSFSRLVFPSAVMGLIISWLCVGGFRAVCIVMTLAGCGQLFAISIVYYLGYRFSDVLIVLPTLIFMLILSGAIHLINYLIDARQQDPQASSTEALRRGWWPCVLSALTTMLGMCSLLSSDLAPVRNFGGLAALCLGLSTLILLLAFPALTDLVYRFRISPPISGTHPPRRVFRGLRFPEGLSERFLDWQSRNATTISGFGLLLLIVAAIGLTLLKASTKFSEMFAKDHPTYQDLEWFERNIGSISAVEVLLSYPREENENILAQAINVAKVCRQIEVHPELGSTFSATCFLPTISQSSGLRATALRAAQKKNIEANLSQLQHNRLLFQSTEQTIWRISARVPAITALSLGQMKEFVDKQVREALSDADSPPQLTITGLAPLVFETQMTVLSDLGISFLSAYLLITPVMVLVVRSLGGGLLIMLPNLLPVAIVFGVMGYCGYSLDIASILTASVALGIAVDDTLHFVCWYVKQLQISDSGSLTSQVASRAVRRAFGVCSSAVLHTTLISCCSMMPFLFANFQPTRQFATLMIAILAIALLGDLVLLPALLQTRAGRSIGQVRRIVGKKVAKINS